MALGSALTDRARVVRHSSVGARTDGSKRTRQTTGPEFRCLYDPGDATEARSVGGVRIVERGAVLLCAKRHRDGTALELKNDDEVIIDSRRFGTIRMQINGNPERIVKKRTSIGILVNLQAVDRSSAG